MHRVGRTGRFGTDGLSLTMTSKSDEHDEEFVDLIAQHYKIEINPIKSFEDIQKIYCEMRPENTEKV